IGAFIWLVREETSPDFEGELNSWYSEEHFAAVSALAGVRGVKRYRATAGAPKYLALYELAMPAVIDSKDWRKLFETPRAIKARSGRTNVAENLGQFWKVVFPEEARSEAAIWAGRHPMDAWKA